ncbi:MAG: hypothetical protein KatS3mg115_0333 [Candidatus Poribacteria bacterium]|nr:MAG: hypothetical protein KatS3mg115_0333 [Candidatus Poribacteria bacterium]
MSGLDFLGTAVELRDPQGNLVPLSVLDAANVLTVSYSGLSAQGLYQLSVSGVRDVAGNAAGPVTLRFLFDSTPNRPGSLARRRPRGRRLNPKRFRSLVVQVDPGSGSPIDWDAAAVGLSRDGQTVAGTILVEEEAHLLRFRPTTPLRSARAERKLSVPDHPLRRGGQLHHRHDRLPVRQPSHHDSQAQREQTKFRCWWPTRRRCLGRGRFVWSGRTR